MKAMAVTAFGGPEVLQPIDMPIPEPGPGEILIRVEASSVNPVDYKIRDGRAGFLMPDLPAIGHPDCAGTVVALGRDADHFALGDRVFSFASGFAGKPGALAELMVADARMAAKMPASLTFAEAAALPLVCVTAWYVLVDRAAIGPGTSIFVEGGTGGVGHVAIQIAKAAGATVHAACGTDEKCRIAEDLGADRTFNYRTASVEEIVAQSPGGTGYDIVFNTPGAPSVDHAVAIAKFGGEIYDILGEFPTKPGFQAKWLTFRSVFAGRPILQDADQDSVGKILSDVARLVDSGALRPLIDPKHYTFAEAGAAHTHAEHGAPMGKVVLTAR